MKKENDLFETLFTAFTDPYLKMFPLKSIWLPERIITGEGAIKIIEAGNTVLVKEGKLIDSDGTVSHKITMLHGTLANTKFTITVENLSTNELSIINL